jgi:hypothetical protein
MAQLTTIRWKAKGTESEFLKLLENVNAYVARGPFYYVITGITCETFETDAVIAPSGEVVQRSWSKDLFEIIVDFAVHDTIESGRKRASEDDLRIILSPRT